MKLVIGIVRPEKANDVLEALYRADVRGLSISRVQGHGGELDRVETYRGTTVKVGLADKVRFEIAVSDRFVQPTIDALCEGGQTGEVGDGKIFVVPLERVVRIRTRETDDLAVTPVGRVMDSLILAQAAKVDTGDTAWMLVCDRPRPPDDSGPRALLRGTRAGEECAQHVHDVHRRARRRNRHVGAGGLFACVRRDR